MKKYIHKEFKPAAKCRGKNCYNSEKEAEIVAREQESFDLKRELKVDVYKCAWCGKWHLTSSKN